MKTKTLDDYSVVLKNQEEFNKLNKADSHFSYGSTHFALHLKGQYTTNLMDKIIRPSEIFTKEEKEEIKNYLIEKFEQAINKRVAEQKALFKEELFKDM